MRAIGKIIGAALLFWGFLLLELHVSKSVHHDPRPLSRPDTSISSSDPTRRDRIVDAFIHSWDAYSEYAWGMDEINPCTSIGLNNWGGVAMTMIDALDTAILMRLNSRVQAAIEFIAHNFSFVKDHPMNTFEHTIRLLGGLISSYDLTKDKRLLKVAELVGNGLLPAFSDKGVLPEVNTLKRRARSGYTTLAAKGSVQLEFARLALITNSSCISCRESFMHAAHSWKQFLKFAIKPNSLNGGDDSLHEYMLKLYLLGNSSDHVLRKGYNEMILNVKQSLSYKSAGETFVVNRAHFTEHLACFFPGLVVLGVTTNASDHAEDDMRFAKQLLHGCYSLYEKNTVSGLAPDAMILHDSHMKITDPKFDLRPETIESIFYMWRHTGDIRYRDWAWRIFLSIDKHCKSRYGYSGLTSVYTMEKKQSQPSFWMAEVLKYLYLIFDDAQTMALDKFVLSTEAHPFTIQPWKLYDS